MMIDHLRVLKVLCDTDTLFHNIKDEKSEKERQALTKLLEMRASGRLLMFRCRVNLLEVTNTKKHEQRNKLEADYMALDPVAKEESVSGFHYVPGPGGSFTSNPVSDLDWAVFQECRTRCLSEKRCASHPACY
jgi:hypothetical protein